MHESQIYPMRSDWRSNFRKASTATQLIEGHHELHLGAGRAFKQHFSVV
jgi:hypothetical protein